MSTLNEAIEAWRALSGGHDVSALLDAEADDIVRGAKRLAAAVPDRIVKQYRAAAALLRAAAEAKGQSRYCADCGAAPGQIHQCGARAEQEAKPLDKYERVTAAVDKFFTSHTPEEVVEYMRKVVPHVFKDRACEVLRVDLGHVPKMNADERQCGSCGRVYNASALINGFCRSCTVPR